MGADADGEREENGEGETGRFDQAAQRQLEIGEYRLKPGPLPDLAAPCLDQSRISKRAKGGLTRLFSREMLEAHELLGFLFDMLAQLFSQFTIEMLTTEQSVPPA